jgi:hypothetical protein
MQKKIQLSRHFEAVVGHVGCLVKHSKGPFDRFWSAMFYKFLCRGVTVLVTASYVQLRHCTAVT